MPAFPSHQLRAETLHTSWPKRPPPRDGMEANSHTITVGGALSGGEKEREHVHTEVILVIASASPRGNEGRMPHAQDFGGAFFPSCCDNHYCM